MIAQFSRHLSRGLFIMDSCRHLSHGFPKLSARALLGTSVYSGDARSSVIGFSVACS